ncbi:MAG: omptin family outer membrane protease, partial [Spirochaetota bacterium]
PCPEAADLHDQSEKETLIEGSFLFQSGIKRGTVYEYVFSGSRKVSELDWQLRSCVYAGMSADGVIGRRVWLSGNLVFGINENIGYISDSDWKVTGEKTNYSRHSNVLEKALFSDFAVGLVIRPLCPLRVIPLAGINYYDIKMSARNGFLEYPPGADREAVFGTVMSYRQQYLIPVAGIRADYQLQNFLIAGWGTYGYFGLCRAVDNHFMRSLDFYDEMRNVQKWEAGVSCDYYLSERFLLRIKSSGVYIPRTKGSDYYINTSTGKKSIVYENSAGAGMTMWDIGLAAGMRL